jgi:ligand-binding sensor domain-containing protein/signal transduction histidine kinase
MKRYDQFLIWVFIFFLACNNHQEKIVNELGGPKVVEAKPFIVSLDSMAKPTVTPVGSPVVVPAIPAKVVTWNTNVHPAGIPKIVEAGIPKISTPGQGNYTLPKILPAIDSPIIAGIPEVVIAKEAYTKDQNPQNFSSFNKLQGLKQPDVSCILQDRNGNLWFGAGGAVGRYDGKAFTNFTKKEGLSDNVVFTILEDKNGNLWFGTEGDGVYKYDGAKITHFTEKQGLGNNDVRSMLQDKNGNLWFGTRRGIIKYDGKAFTHFNEKQGLSNNFVLSILEDTNGNLWIGTFGGGVCKYDGKSFSCFTTKEGLLSDSVFSIAKDRSGNLWFGTLKGVNKYDGKNFFHFTKKEGLVDENVFCILEDKSGNLWFGTHGGGISKFDGKSFTALTETEGLSSNVVWGITQDESGNLWFATMGGGINKFNGKTFTHFTEKDGLSNKNVRNILQDTTGNLWFGTSFGITKYDGKKFTQFVDKRGVTYNDTWGMNQDKKGNLWIGTFGGGVSKYDGKTFTQFTTKEGLANNGVWSIIEDRSGNLWFGTGGGVDKYDGKTFTRFTKRQGLLNNFVFAILEDKKGNLWFGTDSGVSRYDGRTFTNFMTDGGFPNKLVSSILEDRDGSIWFSTFGGGVCKYDGKTFTYFTEKEGLSNNVVCSMLEDKKGHLWFGTNFGLNKLEKEKLYPLNKNIVQTRESTNAFPIPDNSNSQTVLFKSYTYEEGFSGIGVNPGKNIFEDKDGTVWIGANQMLTAFHQENETKDTLAPNLQLTGLEVFDQKIPWLNLENKQDSVIVLGNGIKLKNFDFSGVSKWYGIPEDLRLEYNNNNLTFQVVGITLNSPKKVRYQYILEGLDKNWSALTSRTEAPYGNLPFGNYVFKVRAMNGEGYWSKELSYPFTIRPPWWHTWWAYGLYTLLILAMLLMVYRYQKKRIIRIEQQKAQKKELEHAREIEKAYTKLQETQAQLIQSEKMASLGELTAAIAHEIQNPLNFVNNFSELNTDLIDEMKSELKGGNDNEAILLANSIKENELKINHHGKRADAIVKGMLLHSRTNSGVKEPVEINGLVDEYVRLAYHGMRAKDKEFNVTINTHFDKNIERLNVVPQDVGRVILNLMNNAFYSVSEKKKKNGNNYEPEVLVSTKKTDGKIEIVVKDNGIGVPQKVRDKIFQPFFTTKPAGHGTGLGLSLSYDIVKAHGGEIKVESTEGEYSEFVINLPG